jgi:hypothetical protein
MKDHLKLLHSRRMKAPAPTRNPTIVVQNQLKRKSA